MPADETGRTAYYQPGGILADLAEYAEEEALRVARQDVERAKALAAQDRVSKHELILALSFLAQSCMAVVGVAEVRGERIPVDD